MAYNHGVRILEAETSIVAPIEGNCGLQVVVGTAPVHLAKDPYSATNVPKLVYNLEEATAEVGYNSNMSYTINHAVYASFNLTPVAPLVLINVLDPEKHNKDVDETEIPVSKHVATLEVEGMLLDKLVVTASDATLTADVDYIATFDNYGYPVITLLESGSAYSATSLTVSGVAIDVTKVTEADIIGGYNASTDETSGLELIKQIYPRFGMTPGILLAPGFSKSAAVSAVMVAKCENINGCFSCECVVDIDSTASGATKYSDVKVQKEKQGLTSARCIATWPMVAVADKKLYYSAVFAANLCYYDVKNDDVPSFGSNRPMSINGLVAESGKEIILDREQANQVNSIGVVTAINQNGFKTWGNNTCTYPSTTDPKDRWINCRRFFTWWGNSFILTYFQKVDKAADYRLIKSIVDSENIRGNAYVAQGKCAGCRIEFIESENPITDILNGKIQFHQYLAPYTPAEDIVNVLEFDPSMLEDALMGGEF